MKDNNRIFYILTPTRGEQWDDGNGGYYKKAIYYCQAWERGEMFGEWKNTKITHRYQASIFAILKVIIALAEQEWKGEVVAYIPDELIVREANGNQRDKYHYGEDYKPQPADRGFKHLSIKDLEDIIQYSSQLQNIWGKWVRLTRWIYLGSAYKRAKQAGIDLKIKLLSKENIKIANQAQQAFFQSPSTPTHVNKEATK